MREVRVDAPTLTSDFAAALAALDVKLPLRLSLEEANVIVDDDGEDLLIVEIEADTRRPDDKAREIAEWMVLAVNTCGGFVAVPTNDRTEPLRWEPRYPTADCPLPTAGGPEGRS